MNSNISESKCYTGERVLGRALVTVHLLTSAGVTSYPLPHLLRHSPDGFNWGYRENQVRLMEAEAQSFGWSTHGQGRWHCGCCPALEDERATGKTAVIPG